MKKIGVALVGYGLSAKVFHWPLLSVHGAFEFVSVVSRSEQKDLPGQMICQTWEDMLTDSRVELVVLCTPNNLHAAQSREALMAGKNVLCEKPFALSSDEAKDLGRLAKERGRVLAVFHNRRWDADHLTLKSALASGVLGEAMYFESQYDRSRPVVGSKWKETEVAGGGVLYDLGTHLIDQCLDLFGPPQGISASLSAQRPGARNTDFFSIRFQYERGLVVNLRSSSFCAVPSHKSMLYGTKGTVVLTGQDPQEPQLAAGISPLSEGFGAGGIQAFGKSFEGKEILIPVLKGEYWRHTELLAEALEKGGPSPVGAEAARLVAEVIECCLKSAEAGSTLPFAPSAPQ